MGLSGNTRNELWSPSGSIAHRPYHRRLTMTHTDGGPPLDEPAALSTAACLFHGFSDPSRLAILRHLALGEHRVVDLTGHLGLAQSTVSKHLACLRDCGLVQSRPEGRASVFALTHPEAMVELLGAAERLLALTGDAVIVESFFESVGGDHSKGHAKTTSSSTTTRSASYRYSTLADSTAPTEQHPNQCHGRRTRLDLAKGLRQAGVSSGDGVGPRSKRVRRRAVARRRRPSQGAATG